MRENVHTLFGYALRQIVAIAVVSLTVIWLAGFLIGMVVAAVLPILIGAKNHRSRRSEAVWEISENGTRQLWNDGPKPPVKGGVLIDRK